MDITCLFFTLVCLAAPYVDSWPTGAPSSSCGSLIPRHGDSSNADDRPGDFFIYSELFDSDNGGAFMGNASYQVTLATTNRPFRGFTIRAVDPDSGDLIGYFTITDSANSRLLTCNYTNKGAAVSHTNPRDKTLISFYWNAPKYDGVVDFRYTVVIAYALDFYGNISAAMNRPPCNVPSPRATGPKYTVSLGESGSSYYLQARLNPINPDYVDFTLEGIASGWIAVGFSTNRMMGEDDVLGCRVDSGSVVVRDAWNPSPKYTPTVMDSTQTDTCLHSSSFIEGIISCSFSRLIKGSNPGQDYNLNDSYWLLFASRTEAQTSGEDTFEMHTGMPTVSETRYNILQGPITDPSTSVPTTYPMDINQCDFEPSCSDDRVIVSKGSLGSGDYALAVKLNPNNKDYFDFYLEGVANGWVAVGFSEDRKMGGDDVLGCRVDGDSVSVVDTWNIIGSRGNRLDTNQTDICYHSKSFSDGRIVCVFSRLIKGANGSPQDFDLASSEGYYLFYGRRTEAQTSGDALARHTTTPMISSQKEILDTSTAAVSGLSVMTNYFLSFAVGVLKVVQSIY